MKSLSLKLGVILIGLSIFGCAGMREKDWKFLSSTDSYEVFYYVSKSHLLYKSTLHVWIKLEYTEKGKTEYVKEFGKNYENLTYSLQYWEIDCPGRQQRTLSVNQYSAHGNILNPKPAKSPFSKSFSNSLVETICK